jgi:hypothetical protein
VTNPAVVTTPPTIQPALVRGLTPDDGVAVVSESSVTALGGEERCVVPVPSRIVASARDG